MRFASNVLLKPGNVAKATPNYQFPYHGLPRWLLRLRIKTTSCHQAAVVVRRLKIPCPVGIGPFYYVKLRSTKMAVINMNIRSYPKKVKNQLLGNILYSRSSTSTGSLTPIAQANILLICLPSSALKTYPLDLSTNFLTFSKLSSLHKLTN